MKTTIVLAFICLIVLMFLAYYQGLVKDVGAISAGINSFGQTFSGRNAAGNFAGYAK